MATTTETITPIPLKVSSMKINFHWKYNGSEFSDDKCGICKRLIDAPTIDNIKKGIIHSECVKGKCGHFYHASCMNVLVKNNQFSCPICNVPWEYDKKLSTQSVWK